MQQTERLPLAEVRDLIVVGEPLPFAVFDAAGRLLLNLGQAVGSERQFENLVERGAWVERPRAEEVRRARGGAAAAAIERATRQPTLFDLWERLVWDADELTRRLQRRSAAAEDALALARRVVELVGRDADIALFGCIRQDDRRFALYPLLHGLHCATVGWLVAQQLGWPAERALRLVAAALTMNVAMAELQAQLAEQKDPPTARQREQIRAHPAASAALLRDAGVSDADWLRIVEQHHERAGGGGYPQGLAEVPEDAQLLRLVDVYMAKVSPRAGRPAIAPQQAARELVQQQGPTPLVMGIVRGLGVHPPGALLQLASGEIAVASRRPASGTAPLVATLTNRRGEPVPQTQHRNSAEPEFAVSAALVSVPKLPSVLPERIYGMVLA